MTHKRKTPKPCPSCSGRAHMIECTNASRNVTRYAVVCDDGSCGMSAVPMWSACSKTEDEAVDAWNGTLA